MRRRRDRPGAARAGAAGARSRGARVRPRAGPVRPVPWRTGARRTTRSCAKPPPPCASAGWGSRRPRSPRRRSVTSGSPNRILREGVGGRSSSGRVGGFPAWPHWPRSCTRSWSSAWPSATRTERRRAGRGTPGTADEAWRTERIDRSDLPRGGLGVLLPDAAAQGACVYGGPKWTVSAVYEGMLKEEMDAAAARHPDGHVPPHPHRRRLCRAPDRIRAIRAW
jgi:hypothetical protein